MPYALAARGIGCAGHGRFALTKSVSGPGLDRYVLPVDKTTALDGEGFLDPQRVCEWPTGATDRPQPVSELAGQPGGCVLLAADGVGKSRVLESLRAMEPSSLVVNLLKLEASGIREELQRAIAFSASEGRRRQPCRTHEGEDLAGARKQQ